MSLEKAYRIWKYIYKPISHKITSLRLSPKQSYELKNIMERWALLMANRATDSNIFLDLPADDMVYKNMLREMSNKKILGDRTRKTFIEFVRNQVRSYYVNLGALRDADVSVNNRLVQYRDFKFEVGEERANTTAFKRVSNKELALMVMRYSSMFLGGQQWNLPNDWYKKTVKTFKIDIEGFASPLNSQLMLFKDNPKFCSVFKDTDAPFGSLGSIFKLREHLVKNKTMMNNPPYVLEIMDRLMETQTKWLNAVPVRIIMCVPAWEDADYYINAMASPYLKYEERLEPEHHYYETTNKGRRDKIIARFPSHIFVFSSHKTEVPQMKKLYSSITTGWRI